MARGGRAAAEWGDGDEAETDELAQAIPLPLRSRYGHNVTYDETETDEFAQAIPLP